MCVWLKNLKVPSRFCSSIWSSVSMKDLTLTNYNSHDYHIMLTTFLSIAIRAINSVFLKMVVFRLCYFFNKISQKVIDRDELVSLQEFAMRQCHNLKCVSLHHYSISWCTLWCIWFHEYRHWVPCTFIKYGHMSISCQY